MAADSESIDRLKEGLENHDVRMIVYGTPDYPPSLAEIPDNQAPPVLFVRGDRQLLAQPSVAVCGARDVTSNGYKATISIARYLAAANINVVSGNAVGVDRAAHGAAIDAGGTTTAVLPTGILRLQTGQFSVGGEGLERVLVLSEFHPFLSWAAWAAMQRNITIVGLCDAMIVVEPTTSGGTFSAAQTAVRRERPLFVAVHDHSEETSAGNRHFLQRGARALHFGADREMELDQVVATVRQRHAARSHLDINSGE
jgi:DNA processing protein